MRGPVPLGVGSRYDPTSVAQTWPMQRKPPNVVSFYEWLAARAKRRGESVTPMVRRLVLAVIDECSGARRRGDSE